jgi:hypothetical protein
MSGKVRTGQERSGKAKNGQERPERSGKVRNVRICYETSLKVTQDQ